MQKHVEKMQHDFRRALKHAALGYLKAGLGLFHKERVSYPSSPQVALGNLSIAVELMLKTFIAEKSLLLLFKNVPLELRCLLECPDSIPKAFNWRQYDIDVRSSAYKTLELDECISCFYIFCPELRQSLQPHLRLLSRCRNLSIHSALPSFQKYELDRTAYLALQLFLKLDEKQAFRYTSYFLTQEDKKFLETFQDERIERVQKAIQMAKEKSRKIEGGRSYILIDSWENYVTSCPICGSDGILDGYTELSGEMDEDGLSNPFLDFFATAFHCDDCGLSLEDVEELELAGMEIHYDRSSELDKWFSELESESYGEY